MISARSLRLKNPPLVRIAKREPEFEWRGRAGESVNPLFRGFGAKEGEEAQRYDQPVIYMSPEDYTKFARQTFEAVKATVDRLGLRGSM